MFDIIAILAWYIFTFHYASTLSKALVFFNVKTPEFTFHYASTLSEARYIKLGATFLFTFHYASTLSGAPREERTSGLIYIPLCFYFILFPERVRMRLKHLHSTMLLLYQGLSDRNAHGKAGFTFHYASTLSDNSLRWQDLRSIYIPLCFYFINCYFIKFHVIYNNLHSTMLLLYLDSEPVFINNDCIYIPLCFYFIWNYSPVSSRAVRIYIPLCFYFIENRPGRLEKRVVHLHSTMLLLYQIEISDIVKVSNIYIPLCFYFIVDAEYMAYAAGQIYIPLCFYFIAQYDSMITGGVEKFTFHYASTLSTVEWVSQLLPLKIYIPLCFYFIVGKKVDRKRRILFTFHYASTLSLILPHLHALPYPFTFHYASTLSFPVVRLRTDRTKIYIPLCFYFISQGCSARRMSAHLHSTMLLLYLWC